MEFTKRDVSAILRKVRSAKTIFEMEFQEAFGDKRKRYRTSFFWQAIQICLFFLRLSYMNTLTEFRVGHHYTNDQIRFSLGLENLGGIRPSISSKDKLRHLVILTAAEESGKLLSENPYHDRIEGDILLYTAQ